MDIDIDFDDLHLAEVVQQNAAGQMPTNRGDDVRDNSQLAERELPQSVPAAFDFGKEVQKVNRDYAAAQELPAVQQQRLPSESHVLHVCRDASQAEIVQQPVSAAPNNGLPGNRGWEAGRSAGGKDESQHETPASPPDIARRLAIVRAWATVPVGDWERAHFDALVKEYERKLDKMNERPCDDPHYYDYKQEAAEDRERANPRKEPR